MLNLRIGEKSRTRRFRSSKIEKGRVPQKCLELRIGTRVLVLWDIAEKEGAQSKLKYLKGQIVESNEAEDIYNVRYDCDGSTEWCKGRRFENMLSVRYS